MMAHYRQLATTHKVKPRQTTAARGSALKPALNFKPRLALHGRGHISPPYMAGRVFYLVCPNGCETVPLNVRSTISSPSWSYY